MAPRCGVLHQGLGARGARGRSRERQRPRFCPPAVGVRRRDLGAKRRQGQQGRRPRGGPRQQALAAHQAHLRLRGLFHHRRLHREGHQADPLPPDPSRQELHGLPQPDEVHVHRRRPRDDVLQAAHHAGHAEGVPRGPHLPERLCAGHHPAAHPRWPLRGRPSVGDHLQGDLRRRFLHGDPGPRAQLPQRLDRPHARRAAGQDRPRARHQDRGHQRLPLPHPRGRPHAGHPLLHRQSHHAR